MYECVCVGGVLNYSFSVDYSIGYELDLIHIIHNLEFLHFLTFEYLQNWFGVYDPDLGIAKH